MAPAAPDSMRDALATLTRFSAELSHVLDDGRRRGSPSLAGAHLPVFASVASAPTSPDPPQPPATPRRASVSGRASAPVRATPTRAATVRSRPQSRTSKRASRPPRSEGRRRRRDRYHEAARAAAAKQACFITGSPIASLFDVDDYLITHDDHLWAAPALAGAANAAREKRARAKAAAAAAQHHARTVRTDTREGFFDDIVTPVTLPPRPQRPPRPPPPVARPTDLPRPRSTARASLPARAPAPQRAPSPIASTGASTTVRPRRAPVRAATLQPGRTSLGARAAARPEAEAPSVESGNTQFVPGEEAQFVKQQSYCKTGNVPGLRRTRFLRLIGADLVCYSRDLNRQLWSVNVQHSFLKISDAQRRVTVFCVGARRPFSFYLASNDMLASWSRALARASVAGTPRKITSQKTAKELQREGLFW